VMSDLATPKARSRRCSRPPKNRLRQLSLMLALCTLPAAQGGAELSGAGEWVHGEETVRRDSTSIGTQAAVEEEMCCEADGLWSNLLPCVQRQRAEGHWSSVIILTQVRWAFNRRPAVQSIVLTLPCYCPAQRGWHDGSNLGFANTPPSQATRPVRSFARYALAINARYAQRFGHRLLVQVRPSPHADQTHKPNHKTPRLQRV